MTGTMGSLHAKIAVCVAAARTIIAIVAVCVMASALAPAPALAHESLPVVVSLEEPTSGEFTLGVRLPGNVDPAQRPRAAIASPCRVSVEGAAKTVFSCPRGFRPNAIALEWPGGVPSSAMLVRTSFADGEQNSAILPSGSRSIDLPQPRSTVEVATDYVAIGIRHILLGFDHLLFLICLILIAGPSRRVAMVVTGFTLGHAVTISLATLGIVRMDGRIVEALIALSIVFVATELVRDRKDTLMSRHPILIAAGFGTLHGLGFAGALADIGLANGAVAISLIGFNIGVEIGQIVFVFAFFVALAAGRRFFGDMASRNVGFARLATLSMIGIVSSFWFWQRSIALFS